MYVWENGLFFSIVVFPLSGSYTAAAGISEIVKRISEFITRRDGGIPSFAENIFISSGSQWSLGVTGLKFAQNEWPAQSSD